MHSFPIIFVAIILICLSPSSVSYWLQPTVNLKACSSILSGTTTRLPVLLMSTGTTDSNPTTPNAAARSSSKRALLITSAAAFITTAATTAATGGIKTASAQTLDIPPFPKKGFQTKSGLKYFDFSEGDSSIATPRYGDFVTFHYTMYYQANPQSELEIIDSSHYNSNDEPFLQKHGNGRLIQGIEEALHTMHPGAMRRVIVPKALGYSRFGLGPLPLNPFRRRKLGEVIDLFDAEKGKLVVDVQLLAVAEDENDQGYYEDVAMSQDEVRKLVIQDLEKNNPQMFERMKQSTPKKLLK